MKKWLLWIVIGVALGLGLGMLVSGVAMAAGSTVVTQWKEGSVRFVSIAWTSDASGDVSAGSFEIKSGTLIGFLHDPEAGVTAAYDFTLQWDLAIAATTNRVIEIVDVTAGQGTDLSNSVNGGYVALASPPVLPTGKLTPVLAGCGNATSGAIILVFWEE